MQTFAKSRASFLLAASLMSVGAFAACSDDDNTGPGPSGADGGTPDASAGAADSGSITPDASTGAADSGSITPDASIGSPDAASAIPDAGTGNSVIDSGNSVTDSGTPKTDGGDGGVLSSAAAVRGYIATVIPGGISKLQVPATNAGIPIPTAPSTDPHRYDVTDAKVYLGKLLFHDPIRTQRVNQNQGQPLNFPGGTAFGGTISVSDQSGPPLASPAPFGSATSAQVSAVMADTLATGSCGSCHIGEAAGKAGQQLNFNTGGEGRGYTDASGTFFPRRRPKANLIKFRSNPLFPGDVGADALPTLADIFVNSGANVVSTPALFYHQPGAPGGPYQDGGVSPSFTIFASGRLDQLDSVGRASPAMVGFAFNNRMLFGGFGGEPASSPGSLQPSAYGLDPLATVSDPAQENINFLLLDAHRMLGNQAAALKAIPAYQVLFKTAYPDVYQQYITASGDPLGYINDFTESRARAAFLRSVVTRSSPYDEFLAGSDTALSAAQLRGARLFFTSAANGGANCFQCHSGPMLNKQVNETDLAGIGTLVEENFVNVGIGDHPVQALTALARGHATAYHAEDTGRQEITGNPAAAFKFRSLTMRQLKNAFTFFHNGAFTDLRTVVEYFNNGVPQDPTAGAASTLDPRFTSPRGAGTTGLGLTDAQVDDLTDFLENGLYDPGLAKSFQPDPASDLAYSKAGTVANQYLAGVSGLIDGLMPSTLAIDDNDHLARRDEGLEFLNVSSQVATTVSTVGSADTWTITNTSANVIDTNLLVAITGLTSGITVDAKEQTTGLAKYAGGATAVGGGSSVSGEPSGEPLYRMFLPSGVLAPGQSTSLTVTRTGGGSSSSYAPKLYSGQGTP